MLSSVTTTSGSEESCRSSTDFLRTQRHRRLVLRDTDSLAGRRRRKCLLEVYTAMSHGLFAKVTRYNRRMPHTRPRWRSSSNVASWMGPSRCPRARSSISARLRCSAVVQTGKKRKMSFVHGESGVYSNQRLLAAYRLFCSRYVKDEDFEAAARHSFFSGHLEKSMSYLKNCKGERAPRIRGQLC